MQIYLNTYGTYLHVRDALFELSIPKEQGGKVVRHFAAKKVTAIVMTVSGALSTDAVRLAIRNNVDLIFSDRTGQPLGRVWHAKLGSTTAIRKAQLSASLDRRGLDWTISWLSEKCARQASLLTSLQKHRPTQKANLIKQVDKIQALRESILLLGKDAETTAQVAPSLRGVEGTAGRLYFQALNQCLPEVYRFGGRSFRPAQDSFNAFLNYGYGILYGRVEKALMIAGIDPYVGFMHRDDYNQRSMVFDFIEPYRVWIDKVVFGLFSRKKVRQNHVSELASGVTLVKEGKVLLIEQLNDYLEVKKIRYRNRNLTRVHGLQLDAHRFASQLMGKDEDNYESIEL